MSDISAFRLQRHLKTRRLCYFKNNATISPSLRKLYNWRASCLPVIPTIMRSQSMWKRVVNLQPIIAWDEKQHLSIDSGPVIQFVT